MTTLTTPSRRRGPAGHLLAIDRGLDLHLCVQAGDGEHLADCFRQTFGRLPRSTANLLLAHWADGPGHLARRPVLELHAALRPGIELQEDAPGLVYGVTDECGQRIRFAAAFTDRMPPGVLEVLVAHELTHCEQWARLPPAIARELDLEAHARDLITEWGFDPDALDQWRLPRSFSQPGRSTYVSHRKES
jgi:hypothetical protein